MSATSRKHRPTTPGLRSSEADWRTVEMWPKNMCSPHLKLFWEVVDILSSGQRPSRLLPVQTSKVSASVMSEVTHTPVKATFMPERCVKVLGRQMLPFRWSLLVLPRKYQSVSVQMICSLFIHSFFISMKKVEHTKRIETGNSTYTSWRTGTRWLHKIC